MRGFELPAFSFYSMQQQNGIKHYLKRRKKQNLQNCQSGKIENVACRFDRVYYNHFIILYLNLSSL